jgi:MFS family permease
MWAGIYMLPLTFGFLIAGPASGALSDRFGAWAFATGGLLITAAAFVGLIAIPANFSYPVFAVLIAIAGIGMGLVGAPNSAAIMNSVPAGERGAASVIRATGMNTGLVLALGGFFTLMAIGLASQLPSSLSSGLTKLGVHQNAATRSPILRQWGRCLRRSSGRTPSNSSCHRSTRNNFNLVPVSTSTR